MCRNCKNNLLKSRFMSCCETLWCKYDFILVHIQTLFPGKSSYCLIFLLSLFAAVSKFPFEAIFPEHLQTFRLQESPATLLAQRISINNKNKRSPRESHKKKELPKAQSTKCTFSPRGFVGVLTGLIGSRISLNRQTTGSTFSSGKRKKNKQRRSFFSFSQLVSFCISSADTCRDPPKGSIIRSVNAFLPSPRASVFLSFLFFLWEAEG